MAVALVLALAIGGGETWGGGERRLRKRAREGEMGR